MNTVNTVPDRGGLAARHRVAAIVAAAALAALLMTLLAVEWVFAGLRGTAVFFRPEGTVALRYGFYGAAVAAVVLLRVLRGVILRKRPGEDETALGRKLFLASLLTTTLSEVPAVLGLVLFFAAGLKRDFFILTAVSLVLMFMFFPRLGQWREWLGRS
ncbi:MAG: hypothetical protein JW747_01550 [Candidatus Aminicenantes bacterium]|nr:hypothetical protein [Candidatus Aminicenantes bacterium]